MTEDPMIAALLRERAGYVQRGLDARTAAVDEQLRLRGHEPPASPQDPQDPQDPPESPEPPAAAGDEAAPRKAKPRARRAPRAEKT
ncbi:hypothetical protein [Streptomyces synnematoformans]|uniref:Uncharacterized protein n=1 Tax=Streptomyces synnematoformans TaxID=415721 RepID=A0ABN2XD05_9ACTN